MKKFTDDELTVHVNNAINKIKEYLNGLFKINRKRAILLGYWINDYVNYLIKEDSFVSQKHKYNRGDIINVNFGYRIGREIGGRHFAVVIDNSNSIKQETITIVPLTSLKDKSKEGKYTFILQKGLYDLHEEKFKKLKYDCKTHLDEIEELLNLDEWKTSEEKLKIIKSKLSKCNSELKEITDFEKSIYKLKRGSVLDVGQIVTVSKMRILNPKSAKDSLSKIRICDEDLDLLNEKLKLLYINSK